MKKYSFTNEEIENHRQSPEIWHSFVRHREAEMIFSVFADARYRNAIELGAGDGGQSEIIAKYCDHLICTELDANSHSWVGKTILERKLPNVDYELVDAQDLSRFADKTFDLVYSSNLLEHIPDVNRSLKEIHRVMEDDGLMLHIMPNRWWKFFHFFLSPFKFSIPRVHGISSNHVTEFYRFGRKSWTRLIQNHGLVVEKLVGLPFYVGHQNSFIPLIKAGNKMKIPASYLYILRKKISE